jgi:hypothetical protein
MGQGQRLTLRFRTLVVMAGAFAPAISLARETR